MGQGTAMLLRRYAFPGHQGEMYCPAKTPLASTRVNVVVVSLEDIYLAIHKKSQETLSQKETQRAIDVSLRLCVTI
jgi:hypothetical protein